MLEFRTSYRYAKSLIQLSIEDDLLEIIYKDIILVKDICKNKSLILMLKSPLIYNQKKMEILKKIFYSKINNLTFSFFSLIVKKNRSFIFFDIIKVFIEEYKKIKFIKDVNVVTTFSLSTKLKSKFKKVVQNIVLCKEVNLIENIDKSLIGGYILSVDDKKLDESIKTKLNLLKLNFLSSK